MSLFSRHTADRPVDLSVDGVRISGELFLPDSPSGLVLFVHGAGSNRDSPRHRRVSDALTDVGVATFLFNLLTPLEDAEDRWRGHLSFDLPLLTRRLLAVLDWADASPLTKGLGIGFLGAGTGAAASLCAAAERPLEVQAVVSRGGRADLVSSELAHVVAPTLLIVGEKDEPLVAWNREAFQRLSGEHKMVVVPGATHLFPEPGAMEEVTRLAVDWFSKYLQRTHPPASSSHWPLE